MSFTLKKSDLSPDYSKTLRNSDYSFFKNNLVIKGRYNSAGRPRLGYSIPKRGTSLACRRNRLKRTIKESFRLRANQLPSMDFIVLISKDRPSSEVRRDLENGFTESTKASVF